MDFVPSLVNASDGSSCNQSTGLLTPDSSPLFLPAHPKDSVATRLSQFLDDAQPRRPETPETRVDSPVIPAYTDLVEFGAVRRVCVIGAGYVGRFTPLLQAMRHVWLIKDAVNRWSYCGRDRIAQSGSPRRSRR